MTTEANGNISEFRDGKGRFLRGNRLGTGRVVGSRNKLGTAFVDALYEDFSKHGAAAIERVRIEEPAQYLKVVCMVLPRKLDVAMNIDIDLFADVQSFREAYALARQHIGADAPLIDGSVIDDETT